MAKPVTTTRQSRGEDHRRQTHAAQRRHTEDAREIGPLPKCKNPARRKKGLRSLKAWCETYFPGWFPLPWSDDHLVLMEHLTAVGEHGGKVAVAMVRGGGKSAVSRAAALWLLFSGRRRYLIWVAATTKNLAKERRTITSALRTPSPLTDDFPEVCFPIVALENESRRCNGQLLNGRQTNITWAGPHIQFPSVPKSKASASVIEFASLGNAIRGAVLGDDRGRLLRPDLVIADDPQTDGSARSEVKTEALRETLEAAIMGLGGPDRKLSVIMPCTVIRKGDLADQFLDTARHPDWRSLRLPFLRQWPKNLAMWDQYRMVRADGLLSGDMGKAAREFYAAHQADLEAGAEVAWLHRYDPDQSCSALQEAMDWWIDSPEGFASEAQQAPLTRDDLADQGLDPVTLLRTRPAAPAFGLVPGSHPHLTAYIDINEPVTWWLVTAWTDHLAGHVAAYGTWPAQPERYIRSGNIKRTIAKAFPGRNFAAQIHAALSATIDHLLSFAWKTPEGHRREITQIMVDASWGKTTDTVFHVAANHEAKALILPAFGRSATSTSKSLMEWKRQPGERVGHHWRLGRGREGRENRRVMYDTNRWKDLAANGLRADPGDPQAIYFHAAEQASVHQMLANHCAAELPIEVTSQGRTETQWKLRRHLEDNHLWDCLVGTAVGASIHGAKLPTGQINATSTRRVYSRKDLA